MSRPDAMVHLDGRLVAAGEARIDPADRGLLLGDGLFETLLALDGRLVDWEAHWVRLGTSAAALGIPPPADDLAAAARETLAANGLARGRAALRLTLTRGPGARGLLPPEAPRPTVMIAASQSPEPEKAPLRAIVATTRRNRRSPLSRLKTLNYLDSVLARREAAERGADDALLLNEDGRLACATAANLFVVRGGRLLTPPPEEGVLPGIVRRVVLRLAAGQGLPAEERALSPEDLTGVEEAFVTNSLIGLRALGMLDGTPVGGGGQGPVVGVLRRAYQDYVDPD